MGAERDQGDAAAGEQFGIPFALLFAGRMEDCGVLQVATLVEPPCEDLLPPLMAHAPRRGHAVCRPHDGDITLARPDGRLMHGFEPQSVDMHDIRGSQSADIPDNPRIDAGLDQRRVQFRCEGVHSARRIIIRTELNDPHPFTLSTLQPLHQFTRITAIAPAPFPAVAFASHQTPTQ